MKKLNHLKTYRELITEQMTSEDSPTIEKVTDLYSKYGSKYPYATDAVAYFIFGDKSDDNVLVRSFKGAVGRHTEVDYPSLSEYMLDYEYSWEDYMEDMEEHIKNLPTKDGSVLSDHY
jgi:hypothetical protein